MPTSAARREFPGRRARPTVLLWLLFLLLPGLALGLDPARHISQYVQTLWNSEHGLPDQAVPALLQTRDGYLWAGTHAGLARFDGLRFRNYTSQDSGLRHDHVRALAQDSAGRLWIGTMAGGLHWLEDGQIHPLTSLPVLNVQALLADPDGSVWVASSEGLHQVRGPHVERSWHLLDGLAAEVVYSLWREADGRVLVGTARGLQTLSQGSLSTPWPVVGRTEVRTLLRRSDGELWVSTPQALMVLAGDIVVRSFPQSWESSQIYDLLEDRDHNLWVASYGQGLLRWRAPAFETHGASLGFVDRRIWTLLEDAQGNLWAGTRQGLVRLRDGPVVSWTSQEGLPDDHARGVWEDRDGAIWIAHLAGVSRLTEAGFQHYGEAQGLPGKVYRSVLRDRAGQLWLGGEAGVSLALPGGDFRTFSRAQGLPADVVKILLEDQRVDRLWIGLNGGVAWLRNGQVENPPELAALRDTSVEAIEQDRAGNVWIGTLQHGFWRWSDGVLEPIRLSSDGQLGVRAVHEDAEGLLWVGSSTNGLYVLREGRFHHIGSRDGLPADGLWSILADERKRFWFSSDRGLFRIPRAQLLDFVLGRRSRIEADLHLTEADGMKSREANGGGRPSGLIARDGRLWYPTARGVVVVHPATLERAPPDLAPLVETVRSGAQVLVPDRDRYWRSPLRTFELAYTALHLAHAEALRFRYQLQGQDHGWVEAGSRRSAFYTNLAPGTYRFLVQARLEGHDWSEASAAVVAATLEVQPQWHERTAVRVLLACAGLGLMLMLFGLRLRSQQLVARDLQRLVELRTAELKSANAELARIAAVDGLTGLATPRVFWQSLAEALAQAGPERPLALLLVDVDDFKAYNDTWGHVQGDACLRHIADCLRALAIGSDAVVARYGGEEFALLLPDCQPLAALAIAELALKRVQELELPAGIGARHAVVTISAGVASSTHPGLAPPHLAEAADRALYAAKRGGRNRVQQHTERVAID